MPEKEKTRLAAELDLFALHRDEWLIAHRAYYVVVRGHKVLGFFPSFEDAYIAGAAAWGSDVDFLVKQVLDDDPGLYIF